MMERMAPSGDATADDARAEHAIGDGERRDDRAADGLAHLQAAARELIQAARAVLDVAEELVDDPAAVSAVTDAVGLLVRQAARAGRAGGTPSGEPAEGGGGHGVERIRVL